MTAAAIAPNLSPVSFHPDVDRATRLERLGDRITELTAHLDAGMYRLLVLIERFDREGGWHGDGVRSCAHWLGWRCGLALGAARERVRVARALPALPKISAAFAGGRVSYSKVRAMTRVATPENEDELLNIAIHGTAFHVERLVRVYRRLKRFEALEAEQLRHFRRKVRCYQDDDGAFVLRARLTPEQGALLSQALAQAQDQLFEEQRDEPEDVSAATPQAPLDQEIPEASAQRRADALVRVAEAFLTGESNSSGGDTCAVHLHTDIETLKADGEGAEAELEDHGKVSAETSRRLACDTGVVRWLDGKAGEPLNIGRKSRTVPPAIRRALKRRDKGCRFPGCTCTRYVDAHHIHHWADGGETALNNLVLLCRTHHRKVHEEGFGVTMNGQGQPTFTTPSGKVIPEGPETRFRGNVIELKHRNRQAGARITSETAVSRWTGECMDVDWAVDGLIQRET